MTIVYQAKDLIKKYPKSNFTLNIPEMKLATGTITGVVGENGNGKTTLLNVVAGELVASGETNYFEKYVGSNGNWMELKKDIAFIPQRIPKWYGSLWQNLCLKASLQNINPDELDEQVNEMLDFLGLQKFKDHTWDEISTGYRLRFELARALLGKPKLIVLDEPLANLDINTQQRFLSDLTELLRNRNKNAAVLLSSQQLHELESVADQMLVLKDGKLVHQTDFKSKTMTEGYLLEYQVVDRNQFTSFLNANIHKWTKEGTYFHIYLEQSSNPSKFMKEILQKDIEISYYRDITHSTKRLF